MKCSDCKYFEYEEIWDGEEEHRFYICHKGRYDGVGWWNDPCHDFEESTE